MARLARSTEGKAMSQVSIYQNTYDDNPLPVPLNNILSAIRKGKYEDTILAIRSIKDPEKRRKEKTKLPAFTTSGIFSGKTASTLEEHSGYIAMDFDNIGDQIDDARSILYADKYTYAGFLSVSGNGLCIIVKIDGKRHQEAFEGLERYYFKNYSLQIDHATSNINRLRYVSYDPDLHINEHSESFAEYAPKKKGRPQKAAYVIATDTDFDYVMQQIQKQRIDITKDYRDWIKIGYCLYSKFGSAGEDYYHAISQFHSEYDKRTTTIKYRSFRNVKAVTINDFYEIVQRHGIEVQSDETKAIKQVAIYGVKGRRDAQQVVDQLEKLDNVPPEKSRPIVDAVYSANPAEINEATKDIPLVHAVEDFIYRQGKIVYNEIKHYNELNGSQIDDNMTNSLYLDAKAIFPKTSKELVETILNSNRTPRYNPIKEWFATNEPKHRSQGNIDALADCIDADMQSKEYVRKFIRYWMVGSVAMWHKFHSPLMLVLAGTKQNTGKSHFFRYILPNELQPYYAESYLTGDKDENILMSSKILIMNDEMSNKTKRDIAMIKDLCSKQWFNVRKPYGRNSVDMRRIAALAGTSNDLALLSDPSGNRRIIPINVSSIDHANYNAIDKADLWLEAYRAFKTGERFHLNSDDIRFLADNTSEFKEPSVELETFYTFFREPEEHEVPQFLTNTNIKAYIEIKTRQRISSKKLGMELKSQGFRCTSKKIDGKVEQVYAVTEINGVEVRRFFTHQA